MTFAQLVVLVAVVAVATVVKSASGMGYPMLLIPVLALFFDVAEAIVIVAPSNFLLNARLMWSERASAAEARTLRPFLFGGLIGAGLGALLLPVLPERALAIALVSLVVLYVANQVGIGPPMPSSGRSDQLAPSVGGVAGLLQGAAGISGPVVTPWFHSRSLGPAALIFALSTSFALTGLAQIVVLASQGIFERDLLLASLLPIPVTIAAFPVGVAVRRRISAARFERLVLTVLVASSIALLIRVL